MHVHYAAHEFVPMHDHPAVSTLYLYLNDSGIVDILHENGPTVHRPPTHTGAFRIAPGIAERHAVQSQSDTDSDFLRVELKHISLADLPEAGKHIPASTTPGTTTDYANKSIRIDRIVCPPVTPCTASTEPQRSLLISVTPTPTMKAGDALWLPANATSPSLGSASQSLRVTFLD